MHIFRHHKRALLIFIFLAVGLPMLFFGVPWGNQGLNPNADIELGRVAGVPVMASEFHANLSLAAQRRAQGGEQPTFKQLHDEGVAGEVMQEMLASALIKREELKRGFSVDRALLEERLQDDPSFKDDAGTFIPARYNAWVQSREGMDWTPVFDQMQERVSRQVFMSAVLAAGTRVLDKDIQQELEDRATKIQIEYLKIEPKVEVTEEEIQAEYEANKENYRKPSIYAADYVAISLQPAPSEKVQQVLDRARAGEDFAVLADEVSDLATKNGGDLGWLSEREIELDYRKPLFLLAAGQVSEPVPGPNGFYIYKVDEERTNAETQQREIKARNIYVKVDLSDEEKLDRETRISALSAKAVELGSLAKAVEALQAESPFSLQHAEGFTVESNEIAGISRRDAFQFRRVVDEEATKKTAGETTAYPVIRGGDNLYVAEVTDIKQGDIPPLEEVRNLVSDDVITKKKGSEEYKKSVEALAQEIKAQAASLDEVKTKFPQLDGEIKETRPFSKAEYLFQEQVYLQTPEIFDTLKDKEVDALAGPLTDFLGATYFIALTSRQEPTEEDKAKWDEEGKQLREQRIQMTQAQLLQDYLSDLRERELMRVDWTINQDVYDGIVGIERKSETGGETSATEGLELELPAGDAAAPVVDGAADTAAPAATEAPVAETPAPTAAETPAAETPAPAAAETPAAEAPATETP